MAKKDVHSIVSGAGWIASFTGLLIEELTELEVSAEDIHKLGKPTKEGRALVRVCAEKIAEAVRGGQSEFLNLISGDQGLTVDPADGSRILAEASDVFFHIDSDFKNWSADEPGKATKETPVKIYEMVKNATFTRMFGSLSSDLDNICFTQDQIIGFAKKHCGWLRSDGYATFFLFKSHEIFFVADVLVYSRGELRVDVFRFEDSNVWDAEDRLRLVIPQLA